MGNLDVSAAAQVQSRLLLQVLGAVTARSQGRTGRGCHWRGGYQSLRVIIEEGSRSREAALANVRTSGALVDRETLEIVRIEDGKAVEHWGESSRGPAPDRRSEGALRRPSAAALASEVPNDDDRQACPGRRRNLVSHELMAGTP